MQTSWSHRSKFLLEPNSPPPPLITPDHFQSRLVSSTERSSSPGISPAKRRNLFGCLSAATVRSSSASPCRRLSRYVPSGSQASGQEVRNTGRGKKNACSEPAASGLPPQCTGYAMRDLTSPSVRKLGEIVGSGLAVPRGARAHHGRRRPGRRTGRGE